MRQIKGGVIVPGAENEILHVLKPRQDSEHNPDFWAQAMRWDLLSGRCLPPSDLLDTYDVLLVNGNVELFEFIKILKASTPAKIILLVEGSLSALSYFHPSQKIAYIEILKMVDAIGTLNKNCSFFHMISEKPIRWIGVPVDIDFVKKWRIKPQTKDTGLWGIGSNLNSHNSITSLFVAKNAKVQTALMQSFPHDQAEEFCKTLKLDFVKLHAPYTWHSFLKYYSQCWGAVLMSNEYTWGRYSLDFAALGMPVVGSKSQFTHNILFPALSFEPYLETEQAIEATIRLIKDKDFYLEIVEYAQSLLHLFDIQAAKMRMNALVEELLG